MLCRFRTIGNFIDGVEFDVIERRFCKKNGKDEVMSREYFGELSSKEGENGKSQIIETGAVF